MAMLKCRLRDVIVLGLWTPLILLPYFLMMHTPTAIVVQNALANRFNYFLGTNTDGEGKEVLSVDGGSSVNETVKFTSPAFQTNLTGVNFTAVSSICPHPSRSVLTRLSLRIS